MTFEEFKDREEVLRKAALLRGSHVQVTEDMSRYVPGWHSLHSSPLHHDQEGEGEQGSPEEVCQGPEDEVSRDPG